MELFLAIR